MPPGVGPKTAARILDSLANAGDPTAAIAALPPPAGAAAEWAAFATTFYTLRVQSPGWPAQIELVSRWYEPHLVRRYENADIRLGDLRQLEAIAAGYDSRERFLTEITLDPQVPPAMRLTLRYWTRTI